MAQSPEVSATLARVLADIGNSRNYNEWLFSRARPYLGRRVLDAGAGIGTFTQLALDAGARVVALEPDQTLADRLRQRFAEDDRVDVVETEAENLPVDVGLFDSVLCLNVLEHIVEDTAALRGFRSALAPGGRLLLLVPAHPSLYGGYDRVAGHVRRYSKEGLRRALESAGFHLDALRHVNPAGAAGWLVRVRLRRREDWPSASFRTFDRLVPTLRHLDRLPLPVGLSLWAVAQPASGA